LEKLLKPGLYWTLDTVFQICRNFPSWKNKESCRSYRFQRRLVMFRMGGQELIGMGCVRGEHTDINIGRLCCFKKIKINFEFSKK
jgi:hypothetical protein